MPGMWELPSIANSDERVARFTVRHAIMQVNYIVGICEMDEDELVPKIDNGRRWFSLERASEMALTGLARKVLAKLQTRSTRSTSMHRRSRS
jgi:hypothetical protein